MNPHKHSHRLWKVTRARTALCLTLILGLVMPQNLLATITVDPTLLVNTESFQTIDPGNGATAVDLRFGSSSYTLTLLTTNTFQFNKSLSVIGTVSGSKLVIDGSATVSGALLAKTSITSKGALSGATFYGAGLGDCSNTTTKKLVYSVTTGLFTCATDQTGGAGSAPEVGTASFSGASLRLGDARYVKKSGDTMTGALTINLTSGFLGLKILQTASGNIIHAEKDLTSSGTLLTTGNMTTRATASGQNLTFMGATSSYILGALGIGKTAPKTKLEVLGSLSGARLSLTANESMASGALAIRQLAISTGALIKGYQANRPLLVLDSFGKTSTSPHLMFGYQGSFDTNLYRSAVNTLKTSGDFRALGFLSGAQLRANNMTVSGAVVYSSGNLLKQSAKGLSGQLLLSQGTSAPIWKSPTTTLVWYLDSTVTTGSQQGPIVILPYAITASTGSLRIKGAPTGADLIVDIKKDGTSIFSTRPKITAGQTTGGKQMVLSTTNLTAGSEISLNVDQVGSTFAGSGLTILLTGTRKY